MFLLNFAYKDLTKILHDQGVSQPVKIIGCDRLISKNQLYLNLIYI